MRAISPTDSDKIASKLMLTSILTVSLLYPAAALPDRTDTAVRIGLFGLFKTQTVAVRAATASAARIRCAREPGALPYFEKEISGRDAAVVDRDRVSLKITFVDSSGNPQKVVRADQITVEPIGSELIEASVEGKITRRFKGDLVITAGERAVRIVLHTEIESAVASVVASEFAGIENRTALMTIAVMARTFIASHLGRHAAEGFDFCDSTHCQLYQGEQHFQSERRSEKVKHAVAATAGEVLKFRGSVVEGYYTGVCGGLTVTPGMVWGAGRSSNYSYRRVACDWCRHSRLSRWTRSAPVREVLSALIEAAGFRPSPQSEIAVEQEPKGELAVSVRIRDSGAEAVLEPEKFRRAIGQSLGWNIVLSPSFTVERRGERFVFSGRGSGSQVGLCAAGAAAQANAGRQYHQILKFYYPGTDISTLRHPI